MSFVISQQMTYYNFTTDGASQQIHNTYFLIPKNHLTCIMNLLQSTFTAISYYILVIKLH